MKLRFSLLIILLGFLILSCPARVVAQSQNQPFEIKGFHLDMRIQVLPIPELKKIAVKLKNGGVNTLIMEWEASYPYKYEPLISNRYAYSRKEVVSFIQYCHSIHLDVIPLQQSFGHVEYILRHHKYAALREDAKDYSQVNPLKEDIARKLFTNLFRDMAATHQSPYIHIGGDETYLLGHSPESKQKVKDVGMARLYGDYIKMLCDIVVSLGKRPVVWADIALKYPDALANLPKQTIFVDWNYGWDLNRFGDHEKLMKSGFEIWGSPAIRSAPDNYFLTQWQKHFNNIHDFVPAARKLGYKGMVMTSWSTSGVYSPVFETSDDIVDLHPIRRVYPVSGFNMLIEAYFKSLESSQPLPIERFVYEYCNKTYGFNNQQTTVFWKAITAAPYEISQGKVLNANLTVQQVVDSTKNALAVLNSLKPLRNKKEFEHYRLMTAIRLQYLQYMDIEHQANTLALKPETIKSLILKLNSLPVKTLDKKFAELNAGFLYPPEIKTENELRGAKINELRNRLMHLR